MSQYNLPTHASPFQHAVRRGFHGATAHQINCRCIFSCRNGAIWQVLGGSRRSTWLCLKEDGFKVVQIT